MSALTRPDRKALPIDHLRRKRAQGIPLTQTETARLLNVSRETVRRSENSALAKIRACLLRTWGAA